MRLQGSQMKVLQSSRLPASFLTVAKVAARYGMSDITVAVICSAEAQDFGLDVIAVPIQSPIFLLLCSNWGLEFRQRAGPFDQLHVSAAVSLKVCKVFANQERAVTFRK